MIKVFRRINWYSTNNRPLINHFNSTYNIKLNLLRNWYNREQSNFNIRKIIVAIKQENKILISERYRRSFSIPLRYGRQFRFAIFEHKWNLIFCDKCIPHRFEINCIVKPFPAIVVSLHSPYLHRIEICIEIFKIKDKKYLPTINDSA